MTPHTTNTQTGLTYTYTNIPEKFQERSFEEPEDETPSYASL